MTLENLPAKSVGLAYALAIAAVAFGLSQIPSLSLLSPLLFAILLGALARNTGIIPASAAPGLSFAAKTLLRTAVVLLGFRLSIPQIMELGWGPVIVILATVTSIYLVALWLGRLLHVAHTTAVLTSTGTAICGAAAVAGMSAVVTQRKEDHKKGTQDEPVDGAAATAIACVTLFGTLAMFILPTLCLALGLSPKQSGVWLGAAIHEVGQVVAAGGFLSPEVTNYATVTKLGRVALLAPLVAIVGYFEGKHSPPSTGNTAGRKTPILPLFVVGFLATVLLRSLLSWAGLEDSLEGALAGIDLLTTLLLTLAMGAMGTAVHLRSVLTTGLPAVLLGGGASLVGAGISLILVLLLV